MDRYIAFLGGMNLGGRRITNDDLSSHFEALGCEEVATFRASGNVIFAADGESPAKARSTRSPPSTSAERFSDVRTDDARGNATRHAPYPRSKSQAGG